MREVRLLGVLLLFLVACRRPEKPWKLPESGGGQVIEAPTGPEYDTVVFVQLETGAIHKVLRTAWDVELRLNPTQGSYEIWLNAALYAFAAPIREEEWEGLSAPPSTGWRCDLADTAALPPLLPGQTLCFVLDRDRGGVFYTAPSQRYRKVRLQWIGNTLRIEASPLGGSSVRWEIPVGTETTFLHLEQLNPVAVLPPWKPDLIFTRYIHPFYDQPEEFRWYPVLGALVGPSVEVATVRTAEISYEDFGYAHVQGLSFSSKRDAIGYDWKRYDFNTGTYTIDLSRFFVVRTSPTTYYKLRFVDFYDLQGRKGHIKIQYSPL